MNKTILVVDDKANVRTLLREYLSEEGFHIVTAENGQEALFVARHEKPDLVILDIMMPEMGGYDFLRTYRKESQTPVILLTARLDETDKVLGLELGADDYVTKPFGMREIVARIRAVLRRTEQAAPPVEILRSGSITLDKGAHTVQVNGSYVDLTPSEFDLLVILMQASGRALTRMDLLEKLQGTAFEGVERTFDENIRNLRTKVEADPANPFHIETVFGVGYRFRSVSSNQ